MWPSVERAATGSNPNRLRRRPAAEPPTKKYTARAFTKALVSQTALRFARLLKHLPDHANLGNGRA